MNTDTVEREIKLLLDHDQYLKLLSAFAPVQREIEQQNVFFDTAGRALVAAKWNCRIRTERCTQNGLTAGFLTVKGPKLTVGIAPERPEYEENIGYETAYAIGTGIAKLDDLDIAPLRVLRAELAIGTQPLTRLISFSNLRSVMPCHFGAALLDLELDRTTFADGSEDFEIELELDANDDEKAIAQHLKEMLATLNIPFIIQSKGKMRRALVRAGLDPA